MCCLLVVFISCSKSINAPDVPSSVAQTSYGQLSNDFVSAILKPDGTIWTWGFNYLGTLGNGSTTNNDIPVRVLNIANAICIDQFFGIALAGDQNGNIWFWGNYSTYMTYPVDTIIVSPIIISKLDGVCSLNVFDTELYLLKNDGTVWYIKLDSNSPSRFFTPQKVSGIENAVAISDYVVLRSDGSLYTLTQLHNDTTYASIKDAFAIANVYQRRCVIIRRDSTVWAWGGNQFGQLGDGTFNDSPTPVRVLNLTGIIAISANYDYTLALKADGTVWYWGIETPNGQASTSINIPVQVQGLENVKLIYACRNSLIMKADGTYWTFTSDERIASKLSL